MGWFIAIFLIIIIVGAIGAAENNIKQNEYQSKTDDWKERNKDNYHESTSYTFKNFNHSFKIGFDERNNKMVIFEDNKSPKVVMFHDIVGCEIRENGSVSGGVGRAVAGGLIAGGVGSIVGAVTSSKKVDSYQLILVCNQISDPMIQLNLIDKKDSEKTGSKNHLSAIEFSRNVNSVIKIILDRR